MTIYSITLTNDEFNNIENGNISFMVINLKLNKIKPLEDDIIEVTNSSNYQAFDVIVSYVMELTEFDIIILSIKYIRNKVKKVKDFKFLLGSSSLYFLFEDESISILPYKNIKCLENLSLSDVVQLKLKEDNLFLFDKLLISIDKILNTF